MNGHYSHFPASSDPPSSSFPEATSNFTLNVRSPTQTFPLDMEVQKPDIRQTSFVNENGSIVALQTGSDNPNDAAPSEGSTFVTIAKAALSPESITQADASGALVQTTYSSPSVCVSSAPGVPAQMQETTTVMIPTDLPEGCSLLLGEDNSQYVTVPQDGQTYAIPIAEFQAMQQGRTLTFQGMDSQTIVMQAPNTALVQNNGSVATTQNLQALAANTNNHPDAQQNAPQDKIVESHVVKTIQTSTSQPPAKWGMAAGQQDPLRPSFTKALTPKIPTERKFKPIKVDNWGIFLLSRLQSYFQKKEFCDLTIRFPTRNAQIKVHRLMVNACTDFFLQLEQESKSNPAHEPNIIDMPTNFTPETVAPIIKFMYTGRLEFKPGSFEKLREAAASLQMFVLTKLMDAQLNSPITSQDEPSLMKNGSRRKRKRNVGSNDDDPVRQMKKIKKIEKKYTDQEKRNKAHQRISTTAQVKIEPGTLPGKKLPIWKKREFTVTSNELPSSQPSVHSLPHKSSASSINHVTANVSSDVHIPVTAEEVAASPSDNNSSENKIKMTEASKGSASRAASATNEKQTKNLQSSNSSINNVDSIPVTHSISSPAKAYGKDQPVKGIPKKLREINEDLTFEKIRRTGTRKIPTPSTTDAADGEKTSASNKEGIEEDMKEFIEEQKKRLAQAGGINEDDEDDDYYDNDAELGYDDYNDAEDQTGIDDKNDSLEEQEMSSETVSPGRPILKSAAENLSPEIQSAPRKSVRFSLRPGSIPVPKGIDSSEAGTSSKSTKQTPPTERASKRNLVEIKSPDQSVRPKRGSSIVDNPTSSKASLPGDKDKLDETVDEFAKAVEEEQELEAENDDGDQINAPNEIHSEARKEKFHKSKENLVSSSSPRKDTRRPTNSNRIEVANKVSSNADQKTDMVSEILRKFPNILKDNKQVKIKVMAKDSDGKPKMQIITLKSQGAVNSTSLAAVAAARSKIKPNTSNIIDKTLDSTDTPQSLALEKQNGPSNSGITCKPETMETPVEGNLLTGALGLRAIPKVKYTGKRGRPKKVQPGEVDPHADVRKEIEQRLQKAAGIGQTLVIESTGFDTLEEQGLTPTKTSSNNLSSGESTMPQRLTDPSSEAEALSHVASGIATSLGLAANSTSEQNTNEQVINNHSSGQLMTSRNESGSGPLADLEHFEGGQPQISNTGDVTYQVISENHIKTNVSQITKNNASKQEPNASKVKGLEMDWEDDEEANDN